MCPEQICSTPGGFVIRWFSGGMVYVRRLCAGSRNRKSPARGRGDEAGYNLLSRSYVDTAVYVDRLACDVVAVFYKVTDGPGDLIRLPEAP